MITAQRLRRRLLFSGGLQCLFTLLALYNYGHHHQVITGLLSAALAASFTWRLHRALSDWRVPGSTRARMMAWAERIREERNK